MYPEDYFIKKSRLIRQWIAEGFVKPKNDKTLEAVAQEYLTELTDRSLVQISNTDIGIKNGKACHVHDLLYEVIRKKTKDLSFCHVLSGNESTFKGGLDTQRLSIVKGSCNVLHSSYQGFQVRSILNFNSSDEILGNSILSSLTKNFKLVKVVDFEDGILDHVHEDIGNLFHLRYLSLRYTKVKMLPRSIGKLVNLETLDVRGTFVVELPAEIKRLRKLRNLLVHNRSFNIDTQLNPSKTKGIKVQEGIGCLEALQKLSYLVATEMGVQVIKELGKLTQLRKLGISKVRSEHGRILFGGIQKMSHLKSLILATISENETFDSECLISSLPQSLECLSLAAPLRKKLPESITRLQNLQTLAIGWSKLEENPLETLKNLHNLLILWIAYDAYIGEQIQFEKAVFPKLKKICIIHLSGLKSLVIEEGALSNLEQLWFGPCPKLNSVPTGIQHLKRLQNLWFHSIPIEFQQSLKPGGHHHYIIQHVPHVFIRYKCHDDEQSFRTSQLF